MCSCICVYVFVYEYIYVFASLTILECEMNLYFKFFPFVRLNVADDYPCCNHTHSQDYCSSCPHLNMIEQANKWGFIFICCFISQQDLISNSMIILDLIRVFADNAFLYLRLLAMMCISPIRYMFDWKNHVSAKYQLA